MSRLRRLWSVATVLSLSCSAVLAQTAPAPVEVTKAPTVDPKAVAATVNGQVIPEAAILRGLERVPPARHAEARPELLSYLIDNVLIEQYLVQSGVKVEAAEIDKKLEELKAAVKKEQNKDFPKFLSEMNVTEGELRDHIAADLRWDKYAVAQGTDKALQDLFTANKDMFDGSLVRARHILLTPASNDPKAVEEVVGQLRAFKQQVVTAASAASAKLPADAAPDARQKEFNRVLEESFAAIAKEKSTCGSKKDGGDLNFFDRTSVMVESFSKAAFALKPYEMSDIVQTRFGYHLILVIDRKPGTEKKFEEVKGDVQDVFFDKLRESLVAGLRPKAKIEILPVPTAPAPMK
jgi:peptidyl-prolyl cis-trans isomerase C